MFKETESKFDLNFREKKSKSPAEFYENQSDESQTISETPKQKFLLTSSKPTSDHLRHRKVYIADRQSPTRTILHNMCQMSWSCAKGSFVSHIFRSPSSLLTDFAQRKHISRRLTTSPGRPFAVRKIRAQIRDFETEKWLESASEAT